MKFRRMIKKFTNIGVYHLLNTVCAHCNKSFLSIIPEKKELKTLKFKKVFEVFLAN